MVSKGLSHKSYSTSTPQNSKLVVSWGLTPKPFKCQSKLAKSIQPLSAPFSQVPSFYKREKGKG